ACTGDGENGDADLDTSFAAQMASTWHYTGAPQPVQIGIVVADSQGRRFVTQGSVDVSFAFLGANGSGDPQPGPSATAEYVPVPGTDASGSDPTVTASAGVYEAEDVTFDRAGVWRATVDVTVDGVARELAAEFAVANESAIPAPGMEAPRTETLTVDSKDVREGAIDSTADGGGDIPDPELHEVTIAEAIELGRPALVLFGTPAYCTSRFCGPEVTALQRLAAEHPDRAEYIHVEIWKDYRAEPQVVNQGAADWLLRGTEESPQMTEPWLYLIGPDGIIVERWGPLFDTSEVAAALEALPAADA
ncbi:MAG: hypothetical protein ACRELC_03490, partial [Gemmatimonadota bacterium]